MCLETKFYMKGLREDEVRIREERSRGGVADVTSGLGSSGAFFSPLLC